MKIHYEGLDLEVDFFEQKEEIEDGWISLEGFIRLESVTHKGDSIMGILSDEQVEEIEQIISKAGDGNE
jgi:hypothetical protein